MEIQFLGTGAGVPAKHRNVTSIALKFLDERNEVWFFDCGEGTQMQILSRSIRPRKIEKIFITHLHGDHIFGLPGLLSSRSFQGGREPLKSMDQLGLLILSRLLYGSRNRGWSYPLKFIELTKENDVIFKDKQFSVCKILDHGIDSFGYRVVEQRMKENYKSTNCKH